MTRTIAAFGRVSRAIAGCLIVLASLLVFPNLIPWMIAAWLVGYSLLAVTGRRGHLCLMGCLAVLLGKRLTPAPGLLALMVVMLKTIIDAARQMDVEVVLMEIPRAFISDPYWGLERELARQEDVELVSDTAMRTIFLRSTAFPPGTWLGEPYLTDETGIHPNERGKQILAEHVADALERMYGPRIRKH
jgi:hypothetical protein